jgi:hypothetical protein
MSNENTKTKNLLHGSDASRDSVALLRLLTSASLMRVTIKRRAAFLTKTSDWDRLEDAMKCAEAVLADYARNQ